MKNVSQGSVVRITATFRNAAGVLADPGAMIFILESEGDGGSDTYNYGAAGSPIVKSSAGIFYFDQDTSDMSGLYNWRIHSTAPIESKQGQFYVEPVNVDDDSSECDDS